MMALYILYEEYFELIDWVCLMKLRNNFLNSKVSIFERKLRNKFFLRRKEEIIENDLE